MLVFILVVLTGLNNKNGETPLVIEIDGVQVQIVRVDYYYSENPRRIVARFDSMFSNGFENE